MTGARDRFAMAKAGIGGGARGARDGIRKVRRSTSTNDRDETPRPHERIQLSH
jgi:hypothetical protein